MLRCFDDPNIIHVEGSVDPIRDSEVIETELLIADMESLEKQIVNIQRKAKGDKDAKAALDLMERTKMFLDEGHPARLVDVEEDEAKLFKTFGLLTSKPVLYVCNVSEEDAAEGNEWSASVEKMAQDKGAQCVRICASIEEEIAQLSDAGERAEFLDSMGLNESGLNKVIRAGNALLGLQTYFTAGPKEARAWTIPVGAKAPQAAGVIHGDFEKGFIKAEVIAFDDYVGNGGENGAKDAGKMRQEGKDYIVADGDVILFRFNV